MKNKCILITESMLEGFREDLRRHEKSAGTIEHYTHAVCALRSWMDGRPITVDTLLEWKQSAKEQYALITANNMIAGINAFLAFCGEEWRLSTFRCQKERFRAHLLTEEDVTALLSSAQRSGDLRAEVLLAILSETGIRVSELRYITVEAAVEHLAVITLKGKTRRLPLSDELCKLLLDYAAAVNIRSGPVILDGREKPMDRRRVWELLKRLCAGTSVDPRRVHPHAFRHLFARLFYAVSRDIARLADLLGHSSVETTRIYVATTLDHCRELLGQVSRKLDFHRFFYRKI